MIGSATTLLSTLECSVIVLLGWNFSGSGTARTPTRSLNSACLASFLTILSPSQTLIDLSPFSLLHDLDSIQPLWPEEPLSIDLAEIWSCPIVFLYPARLLSLHCPFSFEQFFLFLQGNGTKAPCSSFWACFNFPWSNWLLTKFSSESDCSSQLWIFCTNPWSGY